MNSVSVSRCLLYVAGTAISDKRLISHDGRKVTFWIKDRKRKQRLPVPLDGPEFTRRFMMHVLPKGFQRVRYRGLFSNPKRKTVLPGIREQIAAQRPVGPAADAQGAEDPNPQTAADTRPEPPRCPACGIGKLRKLNSPNTPQNWLQVLSLSPFRLPFRLWDQLDLADWTPVLEDDPPAPLDCLRQLYLPFVFPEPPHADTPSLPCCRGDPVPESCGPTLCWQVTIC